VRSPRGTVPLVVSPITQRAVSPAATEIKASPAGARFR
jgi:hypothetical protein